MRYLLDVNALIAFGIRQHQFHERVCRWMFLHREAEFLTCSITEIGFVRVISSVAAYGLKVEQAKQLLLALKCDPENPLTFLADSSEISELPPWVTVPAHVTDGHLLQLALSHDASLATLDEGIPGACLIPMISI